MPWGALWGPGGGHSPWVASRLARAVCAPGAPGREAVKRPTGRPWWRRRSAAGVRQGQRGP